MNNITSKQLLDFGKQAYVEGNPKKSRDIILQVIDREHDSIFDPILGDAYISLHIANNALNINDSKINQKLEEIVENCDLYFIDDLQKKHVRITYGFHLLKQHEYKKAYQYHHLTQPVTNLTLNVSQETMSTPEATEKTTKSILIYSSGGLGDIIQYSRFLERVCEKFKHHRICYLVNENLYWIFDQLYNNRLDKSIPNLIVISFKNPQIPKFDHHTNINTLPSILDLEYDDIYENHYLKRLILPTLKPQLKDILTDRSKLNIIINWHGKYNNQVEKHYRGISLNELSSIFTNHEFKKHINWISVQKEIRLEDKLLLDRYQIHDLNQMIDKDQNAFEDTLSIFKEVDLIITTDTVYTHLAGTLDKPPCWVLLNRAHDWRWTTKKDQQHTNWYPKLKLFKQSEDWSNVIKDIEMNLKHLITEKIKATENKTENKTDLMKLLKNITI